MNSLSRYFKMLRGDSNDVGRTALDVTNDKILKFTGIDFCQVKSPQLKFLSIYITFIINLLDAFVKFFSVVINFFQIFINLFKVIINLTRTFINLFQVFINFIIFFINFTLCRAINTHFISTDVYA